ncbi:tyrosine-type recombinase/integrase [Occallatibacter savannae]|uniref:tyrosine-type recombinase/integrase n=1 Tax=Occallatibacter savannae TaxID=1002691 RepID=UPI0013A55034|nr:tyrosine-type recombinase/integrase [Occallatibacter savannae]
MSSEIQLLRPRLMDAKETAKYLKLNEKTVSRWARQAYIPAHPLGEGKRRFWRFYEDELSAWVSAQFNGAEMRGSSLPSDSKDHAALEEVSRFPGAAKFAGRISKTPLLGRQRSPRYQRGSLSVLQHKNSPDAWVFRYYINEDGRRVYKRTTIGTLIDLPRRIDAERAVAQLRIEINERAGMHPYTIEELAAHFRRAELPHKACSTQNGYQSMLSSSILPRWGQSALASMESMDVEHWIRNLKTKGGTPASAATKSKVRNLMSALFSHAIRYGWAGRNPITAVRTSSSRRREPEMLTPAEFRQLRDELPTRECLMVVLAASTGIRRGELVGLKWADLDFNERLLHVSRSVWHNIEGDTKTPASRRSLPLHAVIVDLLKAWRTQSPYVASDDFVFPSIRANGKHPVEPGMILRNYIRPALVRLGISKKVGWHSFRHAFSNLMRQNRVDVKTAQELLGHTSSRVTLDIYQQSVTAERRKAQAVVLKDLMGFKKV